MPKINYYIVDKNTLRKIEGPYGKKKCIRVLEKTGSTDDFFVMREDGAGTSMTRADVPKKKKGTRSKNAERERETKYLYRTGYFDNKADVDELMDKLEITDYMVQKDGRGYYSVYNDPEP